MSKPLRDDSPFLEGNFAPWPMEGDCFDLPVVGEIPAELRGSYYRNGSNPQYPPRPGYHWFTGDGMIHALHFEDGRSCTPTLCWRALIFSTLQRTSN